MKIINLNKSEFVEIKQKGIKNMAYIIERTKYFLSITNLSFKINRYITSIKLPMTSKLIVNMNTVSKLIKKWKFVI